MTDTTVIVTQHKKTKKENLKKTINSIRNVGGNIAGVIINKIPVSTKKYEESYYYGSNIKAVNEIKEDIDNKNEDEKLNIDKNSEVFKKLKHIEDKGENEISFEKTKEALKQINEYLSREKK